MDNSGLFLSPATEDETVARKRSRRVSFADTTAVRVFDRDEDFETPPEERTGTPGRSPAGDAAEGDETEGEEELLRPPFGFLGGVDVGSSSPGSAARSVSSIDGDGNFFGVVSIDFIQSGRPSDSGMSEDGCHDVTMDSQTFSMHFNNVVPPDDCSASSAGSLMILNSGLTGPRKKLTGSESVKSISGRGQLTDMSLCAENPERYDYTKLSPTLNSLLQEVEGPKSPKDDNNFGSLDHTSTLTTSEKEHTEEKSCNGNGMSSNKQGSVSSVRDHISMSNPVCSSPDSIQEDNAMVVDIHEKSPISLQENHKDDHAAVHPDDNRTVGTPALLSSPPPHISFVSNIDLQPLLLDQSLSNEPPRANLLSSASILSTTFPTFSMIDAEQLHNKSEVVHLETIPHTPRAVVQLSQNTQGSVSSLRSKRQQLFSPFFLSKSQEACSLGNEFLKHDRTISDLDQVLKFRFSESPATHNLQIRMVERNELALKPNNLIFKSEDYGSTISVSSNSVAPQQLNKPGHPSSVGTSPKQALNEATKVQDTSCDVLALDNLPNHERSSLLDLDGSGRKRNIEGNACAEPQQPGKKTKGPKSTITSRMQLPSVSLSSCMVEENQSEVHDNGQSVNDDWNKVVFTVLNDMKETRICPAYISKLNPKQLDMLGDMMEEIYVARKYKRLSTAVRIQDSRLAEARSLHDKLLYEKTKLHINRVKLDKLQKKAQLCQVGILECCYLKSKISQLCHPTTGAAQMKGGLPHAATLINSSDQQERHGRIGEKKLVLSTIQQKVETLKSLLEHSCNVEGDICEVIRVAEEQLEMRNQCQIIHQQASLWELTDIVKRENKHDVILNYDNLLFQRIILNISNMPKIFVNNSLSGTKIEKAFPNLNACVAFNFVFKPEENQRVSDLRCLQKKTMETSLLLGNLIDVLEEIEDAKTELLNLASADFCLGSQTGQLAFSLGFMSYSTAKTIVFTIDMSDLSCAVYPSEPSDLPIKVCEAQTTLSQAFQDMLMVSIRDLQPGREMILRLCRTVSERINAFPR